MKKNSLIALGAALLLASCSPQSGNELKPGRESAYINQVYEYVPAPGQFINTTTSAYIDGFTASEVLEKARGRLIGRADSLLSLGSFGGYVVVGFDHTIPNVAGKYDFKVYGNAMTGSSEPGVVMVSFDANKNRLPDDAWYEIAGSEYKNPQAIREYEITYYRPNPLNGDVRWTDNQGGEGFVRRVSAHAQASYFPAWLSGETLTFKGTRLPNNVENQSSGAAELWVLNPFDWGYADNQPNNSVGSQFKIEWAVNEDGSPADLDGIDFIRVSTGVLQEAGWTGETSTEIAGIEDLHF
jgi:hypothetical protein